MYRGSEYTVDFLPKIKFEVLCVLEDLERVIDVIAAASKTGKIGDGKIWWVDLAGIMRVRTEERDGDAI